MNDHLRMIELHAKAVRTKHLEAVQEAQALAAAPGVRVTVIRAPWPVGESGLVMGVWDDQGRRKARVDLGKRVVTIPLDALTRRPGAMDCDQAHIALVAAWIKYEGGEFLD